MIDSALLCMIIGDEFINSIELKVFLDSSMLIKNVDKYAFIYSLSDNSQKKLNNYDFKLIPFNRQIVNNPLGTYENYDRAKLYHKFLLDNSQYKNVLLTDSGDVLFQKNPFEIDHQNKAWFSSEGSFHTDSRQAPMNVGDQRVVKEKLSVNYNIKNKQVISSSIQYGNATYIKEFLLLLYTNIICTRYSLHDADNQCGWVTDQGMVNFLYYAFLIDNPNFGLFTPDNDDFCAQMWAISEGVTIPNYNIIIKENPLEIINSYNQKKYYMLHQWNRCKPPDPWEGNARPNHRGLKQLIIQEFINV